MYQQDSHSKIIHCAHRAHVCILYGSQNKQRLFPHTALPTGFSFFFEGKTARCV